MSVSLLKKTSPRYSRMRARSIAGRAAHGAALLLGPGFKLAPGDRAATLLKMVASDVAPCTPGHAGAPTSTTRCFATS